MNTYVTNHGYIVDKDLKEYVHRLVWEKENGPIPDGMHIHHTNGNGMDNRIENLQCITPLVHMRLHNRFELRNGEWWKPCGTCGVLKNLSTDYFHRQDKDRPGARAIHECRECSQIRGAKRSKAARVKLKKQRYKNKCYTEADGSDELITKRLTKGLRFHAGAWWKKCPICGERKQLGVGYWMRTRRGYTTNCNSYCNLCAGTKKREKKKNAERQERTR